MASPRIEIDFEKIAHNARLLKAHYTSIGITIIGVTKVVCGNPEIAKTLLKCGITILADSRMRNVRRMRKSGIDSAIVLLRTPLRSELSEVIEQCNISHNSEYSIIEKLSHLSIGNNSVHKIILMVELGDLREGILPADLKELVAKTKKLKGVEIVGLGTNLACFGGVQANDKNMGELSSLAVELEAQLGTKLTYVSGGNSANYGWSKKTKDVKRVNYLRLGESIFLGCDPLTKKPILGMYTDAFSLVAEVIESNTKASIPSGEVRYDAFGQTPHFQDNGLIKRVILGVGVQDVAISGLRPRLNVEIIGASSDHLIIDTKNKSIKVGVELKFDLNYAALLSAMTSPYITKTGAKTMNVREYCELVDQKDRDLKLLWPKIPIVDNDSPLISLKDTAFNLIYEPSIKENYRYLVREEIVEKVGRISQYLDKIDKRLIIRSAWRSFDHQRLIWDNKVTYLVKVHPEKSMDEIIKLVAQFIAPSEKSMHSTGGAVDGLIYDLKNDCVMDFGTNKGLEIDLNDECFPYHPDVEDEAVENRKMLIDLFENEGFICDNKEYWHFDYGNAVWAAKMNKEHAFYGIVKRLGD